MASLNTHLDARVERYGSPLASARCVVILVHGRGRSPEDMADNVVARMDLEDIAYVAPAAANETWYPTSFLAPIADNQPWLDHTMARLAALRDELVDAGVGPERIVWCGFSQGACAVSQFIAIDTRPYAGVVVLTGGLIGPPGTTWPLDGDLAGMPAYFSNSEADEFVPEQRTRETAEWFARAGADVSVETFFGRGHEILPAEVDRVRAMLLQLRR